MGLPSTPLAWVPTTVQPFQIPVQPRNSTIQCFLLYPFNKPMLPFAMRSVSILALFTGSVSCALRSRLEVSSSVVSVLRTQCSVCSAFFATLFFSVACTLLVSLAALFRPRPLCFQWLADSFAKYRGVGTPCTALALGTPASPSAQRGRGAHIQLSLPQGSQG